jgi:DNA-directed RNA polymerase specialized sigma24 family protein
VMEIEVTAVKSRLQRARANLKEMLAAYSPDKERRR